MGLGRAVGYAILALVDAVIPAVVVTVTAGFLLVGRTVGGVDGWVISLGAGGIAFGLTLFASAVTHVRGGKPFSFTRLVKRALDSPFGPPWVWP